VCSSDLSVTLCLYHRSPGGFIMLNETVVTYPTLKQARPKNVGNTPTTSKRPTVAVVIPTLNEEENLPFVLPLIPMEWVDEVIIVDGHSTDGTVELARKLIPNVTIVYQKGKGKGAALRSGFAAVKSDIIVMLDADGSTDPQEIPAYVGALVAGADFTKGSRFLQGGGTSDMPLYRKLGNKFFVYVVRALFGGTYTDLCYGYNAFWTRVLPALNLDTGNGFEIETLMNVRALCAGLKVAEVPSFETERVYGIGRLRAFPDGWRVLKTIYQQWRRYPRMRGMYWKTRADEQDQFTDAMVMLFHEATHLSRNYNHLSAEAYVNAVETVRSAFQDLLEMEIENPRIKLLQDRYRTYYKGDPWAFFERPVRFFTDSVGAR